MIGFTSEITILRPAEISDDYGTRLDYDNATEIPVDFPVSLQPTSSTEAGPERPQVITGWRMLTPPGKDIDLRSSDRIRNAGKILSILGDVQSWPHPIKVGAVHHVECMLERVSS